MAKPCIVVVGSCNVDFVSYIERMPDAGETLHASSFQSGAGGKGVNQAAACARLSRTKASAHAADVEVRMIGAVGKLDMYGTSLLETIQQQGIDTSGVLVSNDHNTGAALILVETTTGQNRIVLNPNANDAVTPTLALAALAQISTPISMIVLQLEVPVPTVLAVLDYAKEHEVPALLNPAPMLRLPGSAFPKITHLVLNETEAALIEHLPVSFLNDMANVAEVAARLHDRGVQNIVITLGDRGAYYHAKDGGKGHLPAQKVMVKDTTAAGDTFVGAYALQSIKANLDVQHAVEFGIKAASLTVQRKGAVEAIPWMDEL